MAEGELPANVGKARSPLPWALYGLALALLVALMVWDIPVCPSRTLLGIPCPGCGMTRALAALVALDAAAAWRMHPLVFVLVPTGLFALSARLLGRTLPLYGRSARYRRAFWTTLVVLLVGVWLVRAVGLLGGLPDPIAPERGVLGRAILVLMHG